MFVLYRTGQCRLFCLTLYSFSSYQPVTFVNCLNENHLHLFWYFQAAKMNMSMISNVDNECKRLRSFRPSIGGSDGVSPAFFSILPLRTRYELISLFAFPPPPPLLSTTIDPLFTYDSSITHHLPAPEYEWAAAALALLNVNGVSHSNEEEDRLLIAVIPYQPFSFFLSFLAVSRPYHGTETAAAEVSLVPGSADRLLL